MDPFVVELPFWRNDWEWIMLMGSGVCVWGGGGSRLVGFLGGGRGKASGEGPEQPPGPACW